MLETSFVMHTCATNFLYAQWPELAVEHPLCCYEPNLFIVNGLSLVESSVACCCVEYCRLHREEINGTWIPCIFKILVLRIMETLCNWNLELCFVYTQIWSCVLYTFKSGIACIYLALETDVYLALETDIYCVRIPCIEEMHGVLIQGAAWSAVTSVICIEDWVTPFKSVQVSVFSILPSCESFEHFLSSV